MSDDPLLNKCRQIIASASFDIAEELAEFASAQIEARDCSLHIDRILDEMFDQVSTAEAEARKER